jgi:type IV pilus assembly protein PilA
MDRSQRDEGFTLIELMVVVLIIAILIAIAVPVFLGARVRAQDRAAQSDLRNALTAARVFYTDEQHYGFTVADLDGVHANLAFVAGSAPDTREVGFVVLPNSVGTADQAVVFLTPSVSGTWFCLADEVSGPTTATRFGSNGTGAGLDTLAGCLGGWG